jgi:phosphoglycerate kinase
MANTFLKAKGYEVGTSLVEEEAQPEASRLLRTAAERLILPVDVVVAPAFDAHAPGTDVNIDSIPDDQMALDIGPKTLNKFNTILQGSKLVVWNGPMGVFEFEKYAIGTYGLAEMLADMAQKDGTQVMIGGGDSAAAVKNAGLTGKMTHVSTGGGASLELLEGKELPGIAVLDDK